MTFILSETFLFQLFLSTEIFTDIHKILMCHFLVLEVFQKLAWSLKKVLEQKLFYHELDMNECRASFGPFLYLTSDAFDNL